MLESLVIIFGFLPLTSNGRPRRDFKSSIVYASGPDAEVFVSCRPKIVHVELLLQSGNVFLVPFIVEVVFAVQMFDERSYPMQHIAWLEAVYVLFQEVCDVLQRAELVRVRKSNDTVAVWSSITLELVRESQCCCNTCIATHAYVVAAHVIGAAVDIVAHN